MYFVKNLLTNVLILIKIKEDDKEIKLEKGIIVDIKNDLLIISIEKEDSSGCNGCKMSGICRPSNDKRLLEIVSHHKKWNIGDEVIIDISSSKSIVYSFFLFIMPIFLLIGSTLFFKLFFHEIISIIITILIIVLYIIVTAIILNKFIGQTRIKPLL